MNAVSIPIHWHDDGQPIYSIDYQPQRCGETSRLVTSGGDNNIRVWRMEASSRVSDGAPIHVEYLSTLRKHSQAVNVARFSPAGDKLATGSDDGLLIIWSLSPEITPDFGSTDDDLKESWKIEKLFNLNSEIYDIAWSPDSKFIASGSMDNSLRVLEVSTGNKVLESSRHAHYVQGVAWDPENQYLATQSADRSVHMYQLDSTQDAIGSISQEEKSASGRAFHARFLLNTNRSELTMVSSTSIGASKELSPCDHGLNSNSSANSNLPNARGYPFSNAEDNVPKFNTARGDQQKKRNHLYHSESLQSFFRRLTFSPDGSLLLTPSGIIKNADCEEDDKESFSNSIYVFTRSGFARSPLCHISGFIKPAIAVRFSPVIYELDSGIQAAFNLPHKMVFAIATQDTIFIYDTQRMEPIGMSKSLHYMTITDLAWSPDGSTLVISSADGFCSKISFASQLLGNPMLKS